MNNNLTKEQQKELNEIDARIEDLEFHRRAWTKAGGIGYRMAEHAMGEIRDLRVRKDDIINGTNNYEVVRIKNEITELKRQKANAILLGKLKYNKQIKQKEDELESKKTKR